MSKKPSLAEALMSHDRAAVPATIAAPPPKRHNKPSQGRKKALIGYFDPDVSKQLKQISAQLRL